MEIIIHEHDYVLMLLKSKSENIELNNCESSFTKDLNFGKLKCMWRLDPNPQIKFDKSRLENDSKTENFNNLFANLFLPKSKKIFKLKYIFY